MNPSANLKDTRFQTFVNVVRQQCALPLAGLPHYPRENCFVFKVYEFLQINQIKHTLQTKHTLPQIMIPTQQTSIGQVLEQMLQCHQGRTCHCFGRALLPLPTQKATHMSCTTAIEKCKIECLLLAQTQMPLQALLLQAYSLPKYIPFAFTNSFKFIFG